MKNSYVLYIENLYNFYTQRVLAFYIWNLLISIWKSIFQQKLELITGILSPQMKLTLYDAENKFVKELKVDEFTLKQLEVVKDSIIEVRDISGNEPLGSEADVPHFVISEEKYNQREGI